MPKDTLTVWELAAYWGVSYSSVKQAAYQGTIPGKLEGQGIAQGGGCLFDREVVLTEWVPRSVKKWAERLTNPEVLVADEDLLQSLKPKSLEKLHTLVPGDPIPGSKGLTVAGGRKTLQDAAIARLHDLHILVTSKKWASIILKAVEQAVDGDWRARKWLSDYLVGPPVQRVEADVDVKSTTSFSDDMRARAIEALLDQVAANREQRVVDVVPNKDETQRQTN